MDNNHVICLASVDDLDELKDMYAETIRETERQGHPIWGSDYPVEFLHEDVEARRMYILKENGRIMASVAICTPLRNDSAIGWEDPEAAALYIERLAVRPERWRSGLGMKIMHEAERLASGTGAEYMRLYVVKDNISAHAMYGKLGYSQVGGMHAIPIDEHFTLHAYAMEKRISQ